MLGSVLRRLIGRKDVGRDAATVTGWLERATELHRNGDHSAAATLCQARLRVKADDVDALQMLAAALLAQGRSAEGLVHLQAAATHAPSNPTLHANLGFVYSATGQIDAAIASYRRAVALQPGGEDVSLRLAALLKGIGRYDEDEECCRAALAVNGPSAALLHALLGALFEQGHVAAAIEALRASLALDGQAPAVHSDLLRALNYLDGLDPGEVFREHLAWDERHARSLAASVAPFANSRDPVRRLRIGYVSPYFRKHAVTFFLESVIAAHDYSAFDVVLYADVARPDAYSERLKSYGAQWRDTVGKSDEALAQMVRDDAVDVLVDLSGHTPGHRLLAFARRAAPVQVTWNGYPNTTGMSAMDYRITDAACDPPDETDAFHTERLIRLPRIYMSWTPPTDAPEPGPLPAASAGRITFGSFNSCFKITQTTIELWSRILREVPHSRLMLLAVPEGHAGSRIREGFERCGIASERLDIRARVGHEEFLAAHREVDIALDAFPYHGTTTTCFSLWMGVPVIVLTGATHVSRVGLSLLSNIGLPTLATSTADEYVETAVRLTRDLSALAQLRATLRPRIRLSPLADGASCAKTLEDAFRIMWRAWCAQNLSDDRTVPGKLSSSASGLSQPGHQPGRTPERFVLVLLRSSIGRHLEVFREVIDVVAAGLQDLGYPTTAMINEFAPDARHIVFCPHLLRAEDLERVPASSILYNFEPLNPPIFDSVGIFLTHYAPRFQVWDYSSANVAFLSARGSSAVHVPPGYAPVLSRIDPSPVQDIDVLFYGDVSPRRESVLKALEATGLNITIASDVYGTERDALIARSKVIINIHTHDGIKALETPRISYLLANSKAVVTEQKADVEIEEDLRNAMVCAPYNGLVEACVELVRDSPRRAKLQEAGLRCMQQRSETEILRRALNVVR
ncbi:MAG TPA: tetratricopeptide repeat protein [Burkholderiales bacterium]|nr:tetratricopeptide repeat protein [Burkholderiales bacterium]